ncbi:MAG: hypothetical protein KC435_14350, partial [Thermomicrobiales bacterium]|nr:hypothetical protein [Thermomicrobiales bacterium]
VDLPCCYDGMTPPDLQKKVAGGVNIPTEGSESAAVNSVKSQLRKMGVTPNDAEVRKIVRDARKR